MIFHITIQPMSFIKFFKTASTRTVGMLSASKKSLSGFALLAFFCLTLMLSGCSDDNPVNPSEEEGDDKYIGTTRELVLGPEANGFNSTSFTLTLEAPDGSVITRDGSHLRRDLKSLLTLNTGLADGEYRLLYFEYPISENPHLADLADTFSTTQFGLGSRIEVKNGAITVLDSFDEELGFPGKGTAEEPYEISSYNSLIKLAQLVNSEETNHLVTPDTHFRQTGRIDMYQASREADRRYGWLPIGANAALPFRGHYHGGDLSTLIIDRPNSAAVGLFGYVYNAQIDNVNLTNSAISGNFAVGGIVGASLMSGSDRGLISFTKCRVSGCELTGSDGSVGIGGMLGMVDMQSRAYFHDCSTSSSTITGSYNVGGLAGGAGLYSSVIFSDCSNFSPLSSDYSGAGGLIGTCDTIQAAACSNAGKIQGSLKYRGGDKANSGIGAGGIAGGVGTATVSACTNSGEISGYAGVGGLVGSSRVKGSDTEAYLYNNVMFRYCNNLAPVKGTECIGGLVGEAQAGTYAVYNLSQVSGDRYVGGIAGCTSIAVIHNAINFGKVTGKDYTAGIVAKTQFGSLSLNQNYGELNASGSHSGGVCALAGNNTIIHYCNNYGDIKSTGSGPVGGLVGEIGDPRKWTAMNTAECIIGSMEVVMGFVGPFMAVSGHTIAALSKGLEVFLHISEVATDSALLFTDSVLWAMGLGEMLDPKELSENSSELSNAVGEVNTQIKADMEAMRRKGNPVVSGFDSSCLTSGYNNSLFSTLNFYESDGGADKFNEQISLAREERAEYLERIHETNEIVHQVIAGVCIVVGTAATIGGLVASGGAAAPFVIAGAVTSIAGGLNAITKTALEFEDNAVIVSQCVNAGNISAPSGAETAGLVARLQDKSILRDCLNTGNGTGHGDPFVSKKGNDVEMRRLLSLADHNTWGDMHYPSMYDGVAIWFPNASQADEIEYNQSGITLLKTHEQVVKPSTYSSIHKNWKVGDANSPWMITEGSQAFPVPAKSEMQK